MAALTAIGDDETAVVRPPVGISGAIPVFESLVAIDQCGPSAALEVRAAESGQCDEQQHRANSTQAFHGVPPLVCDSIAPHRMTSCGPTVKPSGIIGRDARPR